MWFTIGSGSLKRRVFAYYWAKRQRHRKEAGMRFAKLWAASALAWGASAGAALAEGPGHAVPWQMGLQPGVTPVAAYIHWFHNYLLLPIITVITLFVLGLLIYVMVRFNAKANPVP